MINVTIGTAGHVDHGKTELVKLLTGCDTDRLPEEKARGMSIDLGFAPCSLPGGRRVGIVDVPGHERFLHNMVAGAAGIDAMLMVVAADDGVMPQTIEHLQILTMLGTIRGMVAVTKVDLVSRQRRDEVVAQVRELLSGSSLATAPMVPVSARTGEGFDAFYETFSAMVMSVPKRSTAGVFRVHIERTFVVKGRGVVATGIPRSGVVAAGDKVVLLPGGQEKRIRGVQVFGRDVEVGRAGECVALNVAGLGSEEAGRGMVLAAPHYFAAADCFNVRLELLSGAETMVANRMDVKYFVGTSATPGRLLLPSAAPGGSGPLYGQVQLDSAVVAAPGDYCVVRGLSPPSSLGGGKVISVAPHRLRRLRDNWAGDCRSAEQALASPAAAMTHVLAGCGLSPVDSVDLARGALLDEETGLSELAEMAARGIVEPVGRGYVHASHMRSLERDFVAAVTHLHAQRPTAHEFTFADLQEQVSAERSVAEAAVANLVETGRLERSRDGFRLPGHTPRLDGGQVELAQGILGLCRESPFRPPPIAGFRETLGADAAQVKRVVDYLVRTGELVRLSEALVMAPESIEDAGRRLRTYLEEHGSIQSATFKDLLNTSRRFAFAILEYWDDMGLTRRTGNRRFLTDASGLESVD